MITKKNDFVELLYTGYSNGKPFDSNIPEDLKKITPDAKPQKAIIIIGQGMVVPGLDSALSNKEPGKEYEIKVSAKDGFGLRDKNLLKTIPLKIFTEKNITPKPGLVLALDENLAKVVAVSGARVITDFNNPLAGKDLVYKFKIVRIVEDEKEKVSSLFENLFKFVPEFTISEKEVTIKAQKQMEIFVNAFKNKFKDILNKELKFELKEEKPAENKKEN